jgi:putative ABC transport system permease protein
MVWYNLKLTIRRVIKDKVFSIINVIGLVIGITSFLVLLLHASNEKSFDKHFSDYERIYRVISTPKKVNAPWARGLVFIKEASYTFPEVEEATHFSHSPVGEIAIDEKIFLQEDIMTVDEDFMSMFSVKSLIGSLKDISKPNTVFITEDFANRHFIGENPIGKTIDIRALQHGVGFGEFEIRGVVANTKPRTHFNYQVLLSNEGSIKEMIYPSLWKRKITWLYSYIKLKEGASPNFVADKLLAYFNESGFKQKPGPEEFDFYLTPLSDIHLKSDFEHEFQENTSKTNIWLLVAISGIILMVSLLNYINLSLAGLIKRYKELEIKKAIGANYIQIIRQILAEVLLFCLTSTILALLLIEILKPSINRLFEIEFNIYYSEPVVYISILTVLFTCIVLASLFIGLFFISRNTNNSIVSERKTYSGNFILKTLLVSQVAIVIILMSGTFLVNKQINFISNKPLGFDKENVVVLQIKDRPRSRTSFKNDLERLSQVASVGFTRQHFGYPAQSFPLEYMGIDGSAELVFANYDYLKTMDIQLIENWLSPSDNTVSGLIINNHLWKRLINEHGSIEAAKDYVENIGWSSGITKKLLGVARDFNYNSVHHEVGDFVFDISESNNTVKFVHVRLYPGNLRVAMEKLEEVWGIHNTKHAFNYFFIDDRIEQQYKAETVLGRILSTLSVIGILICILGISALSLFISQQRTKEIGIRKVNGAKISEILALLNKDFIKWVVISYVIAVPAAYFALTKWLESFAYKTELSWWIFALAGVLALGIALLTVSWQSWKAATRNPVDALRYE